MSASLDQKPSLALRLLGIAALAAAGGTTGYAMASVTALETLPWDDSLNLLMAALLVVSALASVVAMFVRPSSMPKGCGVLQITVLLLAGVMLLLPIFGPAYASPDVVFGAVIVLLIGQSIANLMLWKAADELFRRVMAETSALAFWAVQLALFVYAAAERVGLVQSLSAWGMMGILMGIYLACSVIASARRGLAA
ncbi:hypothetical protein JIP62_06565 [Brevundimonas vitis]|uniref:Intracellular septation protein A n=1 Tax=Brevundimonas vitisensis TaxID=2800818 RepID=A0ABX7BQ99_9CAUL|nr:hypothetical protein [Brevundimonas vitisensis]QQQ19745.1 hypothetical protein JIP62_06565 [Brevundimonas vitisensis]